DDATITTISCVRGATQVNMHVTVREQKPFTLDFRQRTGIYVPARNRRKLHLPQRAAFPDAPASRLRATKRAADSVRVRPKVTERIAGLYKPGERGSAIIRRAGEVRVTAQVPSPEEKSNMYTNPFNRKHSTIRQMLDKLLLDPTKKSIRRSESVSSSGSDSSKGSSSSLSRCTHGHRGVLHWGRKVIMEFSYSSFLPLRSDVDTPVCDTIMFHERNNGTTVLEQMD
ncbi:unnamed protein product, partial [Heterotrigona itama]